MFAVGELKHKIMQSFYDEVILLTQRELIRPLVKLNVLYLGPSPSLYRCRLILFSKKVYSVDPDKDRARHISDNSLSDYF